MRMKDYTRAEFSINKYLEFDSNRVHKAYGFYVKGQVLMKQKRWSEAADAFDQAADLHDIKAAVSLAQKARSKSK